MDSSPVDAAWEEEGPDPLASDPPPASEDHRTPLQVIADLRHPHLIVVRRSAEGSGFEPEFAGAMSLAELSRSEAGWFPLPLRVGLRILLDVLSGLAAVHQATQNGRPVDFVHGELAPNNIYIGRDGLGRLVPVLPAHWNEKAQPNPEVTGYVAPERLLGDVFGQPADVFSAGVLLWEAMTGKPLFRNWPLDAIVTQLIGRKVPYPIPVGDALWGVPLADVAMRALLVDPAERWPHVGALGAQIETIARGHLASSDEIAALVAGFSAGKGHGSIVPESNMVTPQATAVTSLSPTASSIQSPPDEHHPESMAPVSIPAVQLPPPAQQHWEASPPPSAPRIWTPTADNTTTTQKSVSVPSAAELAESWSGVTPSSMPGMSRRSKTIVWAAVSTSLAISGVSAYQLLDRSPETRSTATVLAAKGATARASASPAAGGAPRAMPVQATSAASTVADLEPRADLPLKAADTSAAASVPQPPAAAATPSGIPITSLNRAPVRPVARPVPPPAAAPAVTAAPRSVPVPAAPVPPPAPAKPKPKEDMFGI